MVNVDDIKKAAQTKLVGFTEKEIECFVQGAMFMVGHLPEKRSDEWYRKRAEEKQAAMESSGRVCKLFQDTTGLKKAVDAISVTKTEGEVINHAFEVLFSNMMNNPQFRAVILNMLDAEEKAVSQEMYEAIKTGCIAFNRTHDTQLSFDRLEENDNNWTLFWEE